MVYWDNEIGSALIVSAIFISLFGIGEILRGISFCSQEATRKFVHLAGGIGSLSFAYVFNSHWTVLALCVGFVAMMVLSKKFGLLPSVHGVKRKSSGDLLHPIAIYLTFALTNYLEKPDYYLISIMVLSVSDALAAIIGVSYGYKVYRVEEEKKSIEGSFIFLLSTFLIVHLGLLLLTHTGRLESVLIALLISVLVTCFEALSLGGADNILIPIGTLFLLEKIAHLENADLIFRISSLAMIFLISTVVGNQTRRLGSSGIIGMSLVGYAAWVLVNPYWYIPVFICTILVSSLDLFLEMPGSQDEFVRVRPIFYMFIGSFFWLICAGSGVAEEKTFFVPYVVSFASILSIRWKWYQREGNLISGRKKRWIPDFLASGNFLVRSVFLSVIFLTANEFIFPDLNPWFAFLSCVAGIIISDLIYWGVGKKHHGKWSKVAFLRMSVISTMTASFLVLVANLWFYNQF
jgi:dolichol kinase